MPGWTYHSAIERMGAMLFSKLEIICCAGCYVTILGLTLWAVVGSRKEEKENEHDRE